MSNTRLTVVVRKDLQLSEGLLAAQVSHITNQFIKCRVKKYMADNTPSHLEDYFSEDCLNWIIDPYISILAVNTLEELNYIEDQAVEKNLAVNSWTDTIPSKTLDIYMECRVGIAIGPDDFDKIKLVTGKLPTY